MSAELIITGEGEPVAALASLLAERGHEVAICSPQGTGARDALLADALVRIERFADEHPARAIVSVGLGPVASASALVAGKSGAPLACCFSPAGADDGMAADERRALSVLSDFHLELAGDDGEALASAADAITGWAAGRAASSAVATPE